MAEIRAEGDLGALAERAGPLISRFCALRRELPACEDPLLRSAAEVLDMVFANHAMALDAALDLLAVSELALGAHGGHAAPARGAGPARDLAAHDPRRARRGARGPGLSGAAGAARRDARG